MTRRIICAAVALWLCILPVRADDGMVIMTGSGTQGMQVSAKAAIAMEAETGRVLFAQNQHERLPFASTTKIMTALITLEQPGLDVEFVVDPQAIRVEGSSMGLVEGDRVTLRTLAVGMLLPSGNDAANAAAVRIAGSIPAFVEMMNRRARAIGMKDTSFETPSGLDGEHHYSTAYDLALLAREALKNKDFTDICSQYRMRVSFGNPPYQRWLVNHNRMLNYYEYTNGMKTGFTRKAGRCLVTTALRDGVQLICVTLNCSDDWSVHKNLYERFFPDMHVENIAKEVPEIGIPVTGGMQPVVPSLRMGNAPVAVPVEDQYTVDYRIIAPPFLYAPVTAGQLIGQVELWLDGKPVATLDLTAAQDVPLLHPYEPDKEPLLSRIRRILSIDKQESEV